MMSRMAWWHDVYPANRSKTRCGVRKSSSNAVAAGRRTPRIGRADCVHSLLIDPPQARSARRQRIRLRRTTRLVLRDHRLCRVEGACECQGASHAGLSVKQAVAQRRTAGNAGARRVPAGARPDQRSPRSSPVRACGGNLRHRTRGRAAAGDRRRAWWYRPSRSVSRKAPSSDQVDRDLELGSTRTRVGVPPAVKSPVISGNVAADQHALGQPRFEEHHAKTFRHTGASESSRRTPGSRRRAARARRRSRSGRAAGSSVPVVSSGGSRSARPD